MGRGYIVGVDVKCMLFQNTFYFPIIELNYLQILKPSSSIIKQHIITPNICNLKLPEVGATEE